MDAVGRAEAELYRLAPEDFVAERDAHVARAKEGGDRDAAKAIAALRRPSRAAWLTNLLVHDRADEVEGLLGLADTLASAQRSLDGAALRTISAQRGKLVGALSRRAAALGREAGHRIESTLEREVRTILESALADPELADRVRSGRLVKAEKHAGFGPAPDEGAEPMPSRPTRDDDSAARDRGDSAGRHRSGDGRGEGDTAGRGREAEPDPAQARREREIDRARAAFDRSDAEAERARERHAAARADAEQADRHRDESRDRVAELGEALEQARTDSAAANRAAHTAATAEKEAARAARSAETARDRAENAYRELRGG